MRLSLSSDEILNGSIYKGLIKLLLPLVFLGLINTIYGFADTFFVSKIGELQVGAISLINPITNCGIAFSTGLSAAGIAIIARLLGEKNKEKAIEVASDMFVLSIIIGILLSSLSLLFCDKIIGWLNTPDDIYQYTKNYFIGISLDYTFLFILTMFQAIKQACGDSKSGVRLNVIAAVLNVIFDPIFIIVLNMGTFGAAIDNVIAKMLVVPFAVGELLNNTDQLNIKLKNYKINFKNYLNIIKIALPASLGQFLSSFGFVLMSKEVVSYGSIVMSGYGIGSHISSIFYIPTEGVGTALSTFIGQNLGANNKKRAHECFKCSIFMTCIITIFITIIGLSTAKYFIQIFTSTASERLIDISLQYAKFSIGTSFFMGWFNNLCGLFNGSGNTKISMILSSSRILFIRIPIIYLLARFTSLAYVGIWIAMIVSNLITCTYGQILYFIFPWDSRKIT